MTFTVISDHGMTPVHSQYDLVGKIEALGFSMPGDYLAVYDSTMARYWFFDEQARRAIIAELERTSCGWIVKDAELDQLGIFFPLTDAMARLCFCSIPDGCSRPVTSTGMDGIQSACMAITRRIKLRRDLFEQSESESTSLHHRRHLSLSGGSGSAPMNTVRRIAVMHFASEPVRGGAEEHMLMLNDLDCVSSSADACGAAAPHRIARPRSAG